MLFATACTVFAASSAHAHFRMTAPADWLITDTMFGDPQKEGPCGFEPGASVTNQVTTVEAGQKLTLRWKETIGHPGHYRITLVENRAALTTPTPVLQGGNCKSLPIEANPTLPILADGLFPHTTAAAGQGKSYTHEITVPNITCDKCTMQVMQFMSAGPPSCFYFHCADLKIIAPDGGMQMDAGMAMGTGGGSTGTGGGSEVDAGVDGNQPPQMGCGCSSESLGLMAWATLGPLLALRMSRRRRVNARE